MHEDQKEEEKKTFMSKKKELLFGRKAVNSIIKPDFCFEDSECTISRQ